MISAFVRFHIKFGWHSLLTLHYSKSQIESGVMVHACNPSIWEVEAGEWLLQGQPGLHSKTMPQKNKQTKIIKKRKENSQIE
jgi:hypothetical protein